MIKNIAIIQARDSSKRFPKKILYKIRNYIILEWIIKRLQKSKKVNKIILATPKNGTNYKLKKIATKYNIDFFMGSEDNVIHRYVKSLKNIKDKNTNIIRVCADNPFIDSKEIDKLIDYFNLNEFDYAYNHCPIGQCNYPDGFGGEIVKLRTLIKIYESKLTKKQKEHIFNYVWDNRQLFTISFLKASKKISFPNLKFDIDTKHDWKSIVNFVTYSNIKINNTAEHIVKKYNEYKRTKY